MLIHLEINDFALIDNLELELGEGLNVLTGETGAGKTIILDALGMILGERASKDAIREGKNKTTVEGVFALSRFESSLKEELNSFLNDIGASLDEDHLVLSREVTVNKSLARINGKVTTLSNLREVSRKLVDIHGQHQHQSLLNEKNHLEILDAYGGKKILELRNKLENTYLERGKLQEELERLQGDPRERERKLDLLKFQLEEIDEAGLYIGEEEELYKKRKRLLNYERLKDGAYKAYEEIYKGERESALIDELGSIIEELNELKELDEKLDETVTNIDTALIYLEEAGEKLGTYFQEIELDPQELEIIEDRIEKINDLKRKYGKDIEEILNYRERIIEEIEWLESSRERAEKIKNEVKNLNEKLEDMSKELSDLRQKVSTSLSGDILSELKDLAMEKVQFDIYFEKTGISSTGFDKIEFLISPNPGESLKPLSKIASGGELARIMLALKTVLAKVDTIQTLIFDEIDTGISGKAAQKVGEKLEKLAREKQVICVTHLPQIASRADTHFNIFKQEKSGRTFTNIELLENYDRVYEIARMLDGIDPSEISLSHAKKMLNKES